MFAIKCLQCGNMFWARFSKVIEGKAKYCSVECVKAANYGKAVAKINVTCHTCKKEFRRSKSRLDNKDRHFCSVKCFKVSTDDELRIRVCRMYQEGQTYTEIASSCSISSNTIIKIIKSAGLPLRSKPVHLTNIASVVPVKKDGSKAKMYKRKKDKTQLQHTFDIMKPKEE